MKIEKIINNNIVRSINDHGQEVLIMGCGLGFKKKIGDLIDDEKIEKIYTMNDHSGYQKLEDILKNVSLEDLQITNEIVAYAQQHLKNQLNDNIYLTLCDHISFALERYRQGIVIKNALLNEIKRFYQSEYQIGLAALKIIEKHTAISLPSDEAGFIALHIVNASFDSIGILQTQEMMGVIQNVMNIVKYHFQIELDEDSIHYERFVTHLKYFVKRIFANQEIEDDNDENFFLMIKTQYKNEFLCVLKVYEYLQKQYGIQLTNDEMIYLTIHIRRITTKNAKDR